MTAPRVGSATYLLAAMLVLALLLSHRSEHPVVFGLYSIPFMLLVVVYAVWAVLMGLLLHRFRARALYLLLANVVFLALCLVVIETAGQIYMFFLPGYRILAWEPHPALGWRLVPNLRATWTGHQSYAREFSVPFETNSHGFRDRERAVEKPVGLTRIAVLGDSLVEALQVPRAKTATGLLETRLNAAPGPHGRGPYEVLNFGVSNYGMGQFLLAWEAEVRSFAPDVVLAPMAWIHFERTVSRYETGAFPATVGRRLWIRPTFGLEHGRLVREPARDFNEFKEIQNRVIATDFGGRRVARRAPVLFTWQQWKSLEAGLYQHGQRAARLAEAVQESVLAPEVLTVNLKVIETLAEEVKHSGADLVIVDLSPVFGPRGARFGDALRTVCVKVRCGYLPAGEELRAANERGLATRWAYDGHFNETGNAILADAMYRWVVGRDEPGAAPDRTGAAATGGAALGARTRRSLRHTG